MGNTRDGQFETVEDLRSFGDFLNSPGGTPENLAGNLIQELQTLSIEQLDLLKQQYPRYAEALEQASNQGKSLSELSIKARTLAALLQTDYPTINAAELIKAVRKIKEQP